MQGVEILTSAQVATEWVFNWNAFWIAFGVIFAICIIAMIIDSVRYWFEWSLMLVVCVAGAILGSMVGTLLGDLCKIPTTYETQYKVTISNEVSMTEFYEHYTVIDQDGKIFTVKEK